MMKDKIIVEGDPELVVALASRLKGQGFEKTNKTAVFGTADSILIDLKEGTFAHSWRRRAEGDNPLRYYLPEDWKKLRHLEPDDKVQPGQYWKVKDSIIKVVRLDDSYGVIGDFITSRALSFRSSPEDLIKNGVLLRDEEIELMLAQEASKRYNEGDFIYREWFSSEKQLIPQEQSPEARYDPSTDHFYYLGYCVYRDGHWAEVRKKIWVPFSSGGMTNYYIKNVKTGDAAFSTIRGITKKQAEKICDILNND